MEEIAHRVYYLQSDKSGIRWYNVGLIREVRDIIDTAGVHILNCQLHRTLPIGVAAASWSKRKPEVISSIHGLGGGDSWQRRLQNRIWHRRVFRIVAVSEAVRKDVLKSNPAIFPEKVVVIHNGLRIDAFESRSDHPRKDADAEVHYGTVGRLSSVKNQAMLIRSFHRVIKCGLSARLFIAGTGELEAELRTLVHRLEIGERVHFLGYRRDIPDLLKSWDVFVFPSLREGMPLALLEAMASELPVIAAKVGGIPEIISTKSIGKLIDPENEQEMVEAMVSMGRKSSSERRVIGRNARQHILLYFSSEIMTQKYVELYTNAYEKWITKKNLVDHNNNSIFV
ncbi:MAG: glycosyltransferase family 4 protein [Desulfobacterales bacterium]